ncbi:MAG: DEAD/DEAH box helicase, partial [Pseudomonadota bacterium]
MTSAKPDLPEEIADWFTARNWRVRRHQLDMLAKARAGQHALLVADTGAGKTLAGFLPTLCEFAPSVGAPPPDDLHTLYVSPLKALAHDVKRN